MAVKKSVLTSVGESDLLGKERNAEGLEGRGDELAMKWASWKEGGLAVPPLPLGAFCPAWLVNARANKGAGGERVGCIECERCWSRQRECEGSAEPL